MFISAAFSIFLFLLPLPDPVESPQPERAAEACPGATFFIKHGSHADWVKRRKLMCRIGQHDFYGEVTK